MSILSKANKAFRREWEVSKAAASSAEVREVLRWCLPALVAGLMARVALNCHFPYGYFQGDTPDFLLTAERLLHHHALVIHGKKAFLGPILFTIPFLLHLPALIVIPIAQHLAGLAATVAAGGIVRCWFRHWRWFIVPVTLAYTLNPALLWFEHALLAEAQYLFCVTALALAGSLLVRQPTTRKFVWVIVLLFFTAGSRPEGKLFVAFGLGVTALVYLGDRKIWLRRMAAMLVCSAAIWMCTRSTQAGLLLYATVLPLAPDVSGVAPGVGPYLAPLRQAEIENGQARTKLNNIERRENGALRDYLKSQGKKSDDAHVDALARKLAVEAIVRAPAALPVLAANKFLLTVRPNPGGDYMNTSGGFTPEWIYDKQLEALSRRKFMKRMMPGLAGREMETNAQINAFLHEKYTPLQPDWFTPLLNAWSDVTLGAQLHSHGADKRFIPGWPLFFIVSAAGMLAALIPWDGLWRFHLPWLIALGGVWFAVMITGIVLPRYRFVFEPFCMMYAFLLLDLLWSAVARLFNLRPASSSHA